MNKTDGHILICFLILPSDIECLFMLAHVKTGMCITSDMDEHVISKNGMQIYSSWSVLPSQIALMSCEVTVIREICLFVYFKDLS